MRLPFPIHFLCAFLVLLHLHAHAQEPRKSIALKYRLELAVDAGEIVTTLHNQSPVEAQIQQDSLPSSLLVQGIWLDAYSDSEELKPIPLALPMGSNRTLVSIPPGETLRGKIELKWLLMRHCSQLARSPILIFWRYSARSGENVLLPSSGVVRVKKTDMDCNTSERP